MTQNIDVPKKYGPFIDRVALTAFKITQKEKLIYSNSDEFQHLEQRLSRLLNETETYFIRKGDKIIQAFAFGETIHQSYFYYPIWFNVLLGDQISLNDSKKLLLEASQGKTLELSACLPENGEFYKPDNHNIVSMCYLFKDHQDIIHQIFNYSRNYQKESQLGLIDYAKNLWAEREYQLLAAKIPKKQQIGKNLKI